MLEQKYCIEGDIVYIALTQGIETLIDLADLDRVLRHSWHASKNMMGGYYVVSLIRGKTTYLHRFILDAPKGMYVDHIGHNTLDNRRSQIKLCTNQENNVNRMGSYKPSKTGIRGVSTHKCKPSGLMYVFKCSCITCKACVYFSHTAEGLESARVYAEKHYALTRE